MENRNYWLKCAKVSKGMLPDEYAIETTTTSGQTISLFVSGKGELIEPGKNLIRVDLVEGGPEACLIYLPASPLEVSSRFVCVPSESVIEQ